MNNFFRKIGLRVFTPYFCKKTAGIYISVNACRLLFFGFLFNSNACSTAVSCTNNFCNTVFPNGGVIYKANTSCG